MATKQLASENQCKCTNDTNIPGVLKFEAQGYLVELHLESFFYPIAEIVDPIELFERRWKVFKLGNRPGRKTV